MSLRLFLAAALLACLSSCSTAFEREWRAAKTGDVDTMYGGAYSGTWHSDATGHHGELRCIVGPRKGNEHIFHYHATWMGFLSGAYRAKHQVRPTPSGAEFEGQHQMPAWAGGLYTYKGTIRGNDFQATYRCPKDHGSFNMKRVP